MIQAAHRISIILSLVFLFLVTGVSAANEDFLSDDKESRLSTIPHNEELAAAVQQSGIESIAVRHEGWNETLDSWARLKLYELTGRTRIHGQDPAYTVLSIMYQPERWYEAKFIPVEHPRIAETMGFNGKWVSLRQVMENPAVDQLQIQLQEAAARKEQYDKLIAVLKAGHQIRTIDPNREGIYDAIVPPEVDKAEVRRLVEGEEARKAAHEQRKALAEQIKSEKPFLEAGARLVNRAMLAFELHEQFLIVPDAESPTLEWIAAPDGDPHAGHNHIQPVANVSTPRFDLADAAGELDAALQTAFANNAAGELGEAVNAFWRTVEKSRHYPERGYLLRKNFYVNFNPAKKAAFVYAVAVALFGLFFFFRKPGWRIAGTVALGAGLLMHTGDLLLRLSLTGHLPVSNMYESIVFTAWSALLIGFIGELWKRKGMLGLFAAVIGTLALLGVSLMPLHETRIHPLRAVLNSYWLNIHVTMMLISYGAFAVSALFAAGYLIKSFAGRDALIGSNPIMPKVQMEEFAYRLVQVGWPILTVGICLGAIWADTAWGRFWGWDPKETWAFITWIVYTIYLHTRMVVGWKGRISAVACLLGFLMVLITWLGVSYIPWFAGGLHTYASPT